MANQFIEKHKRKSLLALLLLIFTGRTKYVLIALLVVLTSLPFVVTGEMANRFFEMPAVSGMLRMMGLGSVVSALNPKYSSEFVKAAIDRAAAESAQTSYWNRLMGAVGSMLPCGADCGDNSSLAMVKGGAELFRPEAAGKKSPGQVKGAVSAEDSERGEGADTVDLEGILNNPAGGAAGSELYGDVMGSNLADRYSSGEGAGPYVNRSLISQPGGAASRGEGLYANAVRQAGGKIPVPGTPKKVNAKKMGKASGFSWKNVGYKTQNVKMDVRLNSKRPMFQLAETFGTTRGALTSNAPEYQSAYTGSTYDGNDINLGAIQTDADPTSLPDAGFTGSGITNASGLGQTAEDCSKAQGVEGKKMSDDADEIDDIAESMGSAPKCYDHGAVDAWNNKVSQMNALCMDFNVQQTALSNKCQTSNTPMGCEQYQKGTKQGGMIISKCQKPNKWIMWLIMFLCFAILIAIAVICLPLAIFMAALMVYMYSQLGVGDMLAGALGYDDKSTMEDDAKSGFKDPTTIVK
jgi:hypothetical protein